jgi:predicted Zn finger-like uncharacterized protein
MSLATRCSACSTVFRVQQDQLKASEGWVRCGRCGTVFSALEGLFDLERESTSGPVPLQHEPAAPAPRAAPQPSAELRPGPVTPSGSYFLHGESEASADDDAAIQILAREGPSLDLNIDELAHVGGESAADEAASAASFTASAHDPRDEDAELLTEHGGSHTLGESRPADTGPASLVPSFVRNAERAARWRRPVVKRLTVAASFALPLLLIAQVALHNRDLVSVRWPATAEMLRALCEPIGCSVQAPRLLNALTVDSSGLTRIEGAALYTLQVSLRNRAAWAVAMPALELTLTDSRGDVVTRRVLRVSELGSAAPEHLAAGAEWSMLATLDVGGRRVTGYTIELFYP